jgi:hypothetical protein
MGKMLTALGLALFTAALPAEECAVLSGTVTDPVGAPRRGVKVQVYLSESPENGGEYQARYQTVTDETGWFVVEGMEPGVYDVVCFDSGRVLSFRPDLELFPGVEINLALRADPDAWIRLSHRYIEEGIRLPEGYTRLTGIVCDENGIPIPFATIRVEGTDIHATSDEDGYFSRGDVPPGQYDVTCSAPGFVDFTYEDISFFASSRRNVNFTLKRPEDSEIQHIIVRKPNIYLYPPETTDVTVQLKLGEGCALTRSDPTYGDGWNVTIEPDGSLSDSRGYLVGEVDGEEVIFDAPRYGYLFYEADVPDVWQRKSGWLVARDDLTGFFTDTLTAYGFQGREVDDFLEYWSPLLSDDYYLVCPQTEEIDAVVGLYVEPEPDSVLRLFFLIEPVDESLATADWYLPEPLIPKFERTGFAVVEWGVCLDDEIK